MHWRIWLTAVLVTVGGLSAQAEDFRVQTQVFVGGAKEPASENLTLFQAGLVYDYLQSPREVTVFDGARARFILLDLEQRMRTEIPTADVEKLVGKLKGVGASHRDAFLNFQAEPSFEIQAEEPAKEITFRSPWMTYAVQTEKAQSVDGARQYADFCDWYARLNALTSKTLLPFPRMHVNAELKRLNLVPRMVTLTVSKPGSFPKQLQDHTLRAEHNLTWGLSRSDLKQIEQTAEDLVNFKTVGFGDYQRQTAEK